MKLSQAIETAITKNLYSPVHEYMCHVLPSISQARHVDAVQDMVASISPSCRRGTPLVCALHESRNIDMNEMTWAEMFAYNKQLYCWWVFDLKRKGL